MAKSNKMNVFKSLIAPTQYIAGLSAVLDYHTWLSTNCVRFWNSLVDGGKVKLFPLLASTESANECGSIRATTIVTDLAESSFGASPTSVRDKIVLPTSSKESRIPSVRLFDLKRHNFLSRYSFKRKYRFHWWRGNITGRVNSIFNFLTERVCWTHTWWIISVILKMAIPYQCIVWLFI